MNLQRREEIREMVNRLDSTEWSEAAEYQDAMRELLAHIDTLEQTAAERVIADGKVPAVVAPELTEERLSELFGAPVMINHHPSVEQIGYTNRRNAFRGGWNSCKKAFQPIPADRVLGEGMVAVDREELSLLREIEGYCRTMLPGMRLALEDLGSLRANQGGAAT